ncbi:MAG: hypothetical protein QNJ70_16225 [Xenococcaceae cyanobacterium MO_207.B15]|nr:hypothetical protein [Xenococcaceae cyanobacterium MO_207.B15]MDJ0744410.1 hypothetical protein [Xenococcaceae cyanobacterium MO_167.B27]
MLAKKSLFWAFAIAVGTLVSTSNAEITSSQTQSSVTDHSFSTQRIFPRTNPDLLPNLINWHTLIPRQEYDQVSNFQCQPSYSTHQSSTSVTTISPSRIRYHHQELQQLD